MLVDFLFLFVGGAAVWLGAEGMVKGSCKLAEHYGVPSLIIGLTVVAFGTSAPELMVSVMAAVNDHSQIALGNVIGSNIINIGLVLALSVLLAPITINSVILKRDIPFAVVVTLAVVAMAWIGGEMSRIDGVILLVTFVGYFVWSFRYAASEQSRVTSVEGWERPELKPRHIAYLVGGTIILAAGAHGMVQGASGIAASFGISELVIATTVVAFGTSVPELAASAVAARHGEGDLALGNVVGSNLYNILLILGTSTVIRPFASHVVDEWVSYAFFVAFIIILVPMLRIGWRLSRMDGAILLSLYAAFNILLFI